MPTTLNTCHFIDRVRENGKAIDRHYEFPHSTEAWRAALAWAQDHGIDPDAVVAAEPMVRISSAFRIEYTRFVVGEDRKKLLNADRTGFAKARVFEQGEAPPMPFPTEVLACLTREEIR